MTDSWTVTKRARRGGAVRGPIGLRLPNGQLLPPWIERGLVGATAALVGLGVAAAALVGEQVVSRTGDIQIHDLTFDDEEGLRGEALDEAALAETDVPDDDAEPPISSSATPSPAAEPDSSAPTAGQPGVAPADPPAPASGSDAAPSPEPAPAPPPPSTDPDEPDTDPVEDPVDDTTDDPPGDEVIDPIDDTTDDPPVPTDDMTDEDTEDGTVEDIVDEVVDLLRGASGVVLVLPFLRTRRRGRAGATTAWSSRTMRKTLARQAR